MMPATFRCTLITPQEQMLDEEVRYASIPLHDGQMGIAPMRAPLLGKLGDGALHLELPDGTSRWYFVGGGVARMKDNHLTLLAEQAILADEIDQAKAQALLEKPPGSPGTAGPAVTDAQVEARDRRHAQGQAMLALARKGR